MCNFCIDRFLDKYKNGLKGKKVVLFGATGGIGNHLASYILQLGGELITVDRNPQRSMLLHLKLQESFPDSKIHSLIADLSDIDSVENVCMELESMGVDALVHNAGAYSIPREICSSGFDNVFQINFISPYYITRKLMPDLSSRNGRVVVVGSIAHRYSKTDRYDVDFRQKHQASLAYGNAKRFWMYSAIGLAKENESVKFAITHPGITFTNITAHYPKWLFLIIKHPMKVIFMKPKYAALNILLGIFVDTQPDTWIGPSIFNIWGKPAIKKLNTASSAERDFINNTAGRIYDQIQRR